MMMGLHPHADADVRARAHRLLSITCARLGALDVRLGKVQRSKTGYVSTHPETFRKMIEEIQAADQVNKDEAAVRMKAAEDSERAKIAEYQAAEVARVQQAHVQEQALAAATRAAVAEYEREMQTYFSGLRHVIEKLHVVEGLIKIVHDVEKIFAPDVSAPDIKAKLQEKHDEAIREKDRLRSDLPKLPAALNTPAQRDAHSRTLAAWEALHITEGFYMDKAVHRAPLVSLAHRRI
jgi:hypothetical protein